MKDKEKALTETINNMLDIHKTQQVEINGLRCRNQFYQDIINSQFILLCKYASLFKQQNPEYTVLCTLLKKYGFENFSCELYDAVKLMEHNKK